MIEQRYEELVKENQRLRTYLSHVVECDVKARRHLAQVRIELESAIKELERYITDCGQ